MTAPNGSHDVVVIGGGITGLTAAYQITKQAPGRSVVVLESAERVGGIVGSRHQQGFTVDTGPHGFVVYGPGGVGDLADELDLGNELLLATDEAQKLLLLRNDAELLTLPTTPREFLRSPLLSARGKLRVALEPLVRRDLREEPVYEFTARRFGWELARTLAVPAVLGVTGGDARRLSIDAKFAYVRYLEERYGSILLGALRVQLRGTQTGRFYIPRLPKFGEFGMRLHTFRGHGMQRLIDALEKALAGQIRLGTRAERLERGTAADGRRWKIALEDGTALEADHVILALPSYTTAGFLEPHLPDAASALASVPHPDVRVVALAYRRADVRREPEGIGFLTIPTDRTRILATIHTSTIFPEQAPEDMVLIRTLAGGVQDPAFSSLSSDEAVRMVHQDLVHIFGVHGEPVFAFDHLWRRAIPEYPLGHRDRIADVLRDVAGSGGLHVAGNTYHGVGINDCVRDARRVAADVAGELTG
ncbi:oxygen-dependent protoporphyrinogen oxidase [Actinomadura pelletieri DSM 43383]|uniref:Coproporphyrinogen III oxidase n=1 Tax=Actinomadura pelletieri DSM 43383 TaxID=1120940 RepID=A0A495QUB5_9ACTN|nr:protoporphyrinogen oxidase [Actinomadura pelletieri]RKS77038.1 oxygen-dependent protoporphyrinogen oxidase [Actinomadura pelletieri DSM 43383]